MDEQHAQSGQRLAAPADRRAGGVRTVLDLDRQAQELLHPREDRPRPRRRHACRRQSPAATTVRAGASRLLIARSTSRDRQAPRHRRPSAACGGPIGCGAAPRRTRRSTALLVTCASRERSNGKIVDFAKILRRTRAARARAESGTAPADRTRRRRALTASESRRGSGSRP